MTHSVSVVIPCLDEAEYIEQLLDAVRAQDVQPLEVLVMDAGSTDGSPRLIERYAARYPDFPLRPVSGTWQGIPAVVNAGVRAARGEIIVRLDGHSVPAPDYLRKVTAALIESAAGVAGGIWRIVPGRPSTVAHAIARAVSHPLGAGDAAYRTASREAGRMAVDTVPFGCFFKSAWQEVGGFNEDLLTNEDYEFNCRMRASGRQVILDPGVQCAYMARGTLSALAHQYFRYGWWKAQMLRGNPRSLRLRQVIPALFVTSVLALAPAAAVVPAATVVLVLLLAVYFATLLGAAITIARRNHDVRLVAPLVAAFATVHVLWGAGVLINLGTGGHWPSWRTARRAATASAGGFSLAQLMLALAVIATFALAPAVVAGRVHSRRIAAARAQVEALASALGTSGARGDADVLAGPGRTPAVSKDRRWIEGIRDALAAGNVTADPWGNQLLANVGASRGDHAVWVISAGPNGIVESGFLQTAATAATDGDDIGARVR